MPGNTPRQDPIDVEFEEISFKDSDEGGEERSSEHSDEGGEERSSEHVISSSSSNIADAVGTRLKEITKDDLTGPQLKIVESYRDSINPDEGDSADEYGVQSMGDINEIKKELRETKTGSLGDAGKKLAELNATIGGQLKGKKSNNRYFGIITSFIGKVQGIVYSQQSVEANIEVFKELIKTYKDKLGKDAGLLDKLTKRNDDRYEDLCLLLIAGRDKLLQLEQELAKKQKEVADMESSGIPVDQMALSKLNRYEDFIVALKYQLGNLDRFRAYAVITDRHLSMLSRAIKEMKKALTRGLTQDVAYWEQTLMELKVISETTAAADLSKAIGENTQDLVTYKSKFLMEAMEKVGTEASRPVLATETFRILCDDMEKTLGNLEKIADDANNDQKRWEEQSELLPVLSIDRPKRGDDILRNRKGLRKKN